MKRLLLSLSIILLTTGAGHLAQPRTGLQVRWGVENTRYNTEVTTSHENWRNVRTVQGKDFSASDEQIAVECSKRHEALWESYTHDCAAHGKQPDEDEFRNIKKSQDSFCWGVTQKYAPTLYFDFVAPNHNQYTLEEISIDYLWRGPKGGGGFLENEAWYDIVVGQREYPLRRRLIFTGHGRTHLRFWKQGTNALLFIRINFKFQVAGRFETASVGPIGLNL
jgi:hypothetical protein